MPDVYLMLKIKRALHTLNRLYYVEMLPGLCYYIVIKKRLLNEKSGVFTFISFTDFSIWLKILELFSGGYSGEEKQRRIIVTKY